MSGEKGLGRRDFLGVLGLGAAAVAGCSSGGREDGGAESGAEASVDAEASVSPDAGLPEAGFDAQGADAAEEPLAEASVEGGESAAPLVRLSTLPESATLFPLGFSTGDALADAVVCQGRVVGAARVKLVVHELSGASVSRVAWDAEFAAGLDGFSKVEASGLRRGAWHECALVALDNAGNPVARSPIARTRATLANDALERVRFAGLSCTNQVARPFPLLTHAAQRGDLDFFVHVGDTVYADYSTDAVTQAEYRAKYEQNWTSQGFRDLFGAMGLYATWDDHEVLNNWDPEMLPASRVDVAREVFFEHLPVRRRAASPNRLWRSARWGQTLELFVLDLRSERRPSTRTTAGATYVSAEQLAFLQEGLAASTARWKFVLNPVPIFRSNNSTPYADRWEGYAAQRNALLDSITSRGLRNVWFLSGDLHYSAVVRVEPTGPRAGLYDVLMGHNNVGNPFGATQTDAAQRDFLADGRNYTVFTADPAANALTITYVGTGGVTLFERSYPAA